MKKSMLSVVSGALICLFTVNIATMAQQDHPTHPPKSKEDSIKPPHNANEFMHQTPVDQLVKWFDSPERDNYQQPEKVLAYLGDIKGKKIMDIGSGSGYFSIKLAKAGAEVIAADVNDEFQEYIKQRIEKEQLGNLEIELRKIPYDSPGLREEEVDMIFIVNTYHHIEDRSEYFAKARNGLDKEGFLVVIDYFKTDLPVGPPHDHKVSMDVVVAELKTAGFQIFEVKVDLLPYQFVIKAK